MATKPTAPEAPAKIYVKSVVGRMLDTYTHKNIDGPGFHEDTPWLKAQMAAGKIIPATPGE